MPKQKSSTSRTAKLETLVAEFIETTKTFVESSKQLAESDHEKVALMYEFLFVGKPNANPPVLPFVSLMQRNTEDIVGFKKSVSRLSWILISILVSAVGVFIVTVYNHVFVAQATQTFLSR